ncbi:MAG: cell division protein FtsZ [Candidatus Micrarchaeota archaeon]|nr:MAG: cell division protein FtsZ [Candidatus Micrarchaeota archaeon]
MDDLLDGIFGSSGGSAPVGNPQPSENFSSDAIKIVTVGVGGAGLNQLDRLVKAGVKGTEFVGVNTDMQHFKIIDDRVKKILIGKAITRGLGAGGDPQIAAKAFEADRALVEKELEGAQLVFICAGMGGGTGTGVAPLIAEMAKEQGAIVMAVVSYPFKLERVRRVKADEGIRNLRKHADSVVIVDNNRIVELFPNLPMRDAFAVADEVIAKALGGLTWTITQVSMMNIDFADVRAVLSNGDVGFISVGVGKGANKVQDAVEGVLKNRLLDVSFEGAKGALIHLTGGPSLTMGDANKAGTMITDMMDEMANVKLGARIVPAYEDKLEIVAIVSGVKGASIAGRSLDSLEENNDRLSLDYL